MKPARFLLAVLWLVFATTATVHAAPAADCPMAGMKHSSSAPADASLMPCCSQPAVIATPQPVALPARRLETVRLFPLPAVAFDNRQVAAEPHPPKPLLNA